MLFYINPLHTVSRFASSTTFNAVQMEPETNSTPGNKPKMMWLEWEPTKNS